MLTDAIHLVIRITDEGFYATSPQATGLVYGRSTLAELHAGLDEVLRFHLGHPGPFQLVEHHERHYDIYGRELVTRIALDEHRDERQEVYMRVGRTLALPDQARSLGEGPTNRVGEVVYVCAVPSDTVGWLAAQLDPRGDALMVAVAIADLHALTMPFGYDEEYAKPVGLPIGGEWPATDTTIGEIMQSTPVLSPVQAQGLPVS